MSGKYHLYFQTVQASVFKALGEALKENLVDVNIKFNEQGMKIQALDVSQSVLIHLKLEATNFEKFYCEKPIEVGLNVLTLNRLLKQMTNNDTLVWQMEKSDLNSLFMIVQNKEKGQEIRTKIPLLDLDCDTYDVPAMEFDSIITIPSEDYRKIVSDLNQLCKVVEIKSIDDSLIFATVPKYDNDIQQPIEQEIRLKKHDDSEQAGGQSQGLEISKNNGGIIQGYYNMAHLSRFSKCVNLSHTVRLFMKNDFPIILCFDVGNLGMLKVAISPKNEDDS